MLLIFSAEFVNKRSCSRKVAQILHLWQCVGPLLQSYAQMCVLNRIWNDRRYTYSFLAAWKLWISLYSKDELSKSMTAGILICRLHIWQNQYVSYNRDVCTCYMHCCRFLECSMSAPWCYWVRNSCRSPACIWHTSPYVYLSWSFWMSVHTY